MPHKRQVHILLQALQDWISIVLHVTSWLFTSVLPFWSWVSTVITITNFIQMSYMWTVQCSEWKDRLTEREVIKRFALVALSSECYLILSICCPFYVLFAFCSNYNLSLLLFPSPTIIHLFCCFPSSPFFLFLLDPTFVHAQLIPDSAEKNDDKLYFFFREKSSEMGQTPMAQSRIGRICLVRHFLKLCLIFH